MGRRLGRRRGRAGHVTAATVAHPLAPPPNAGGDRGGKSSELPVQPAPREDLSPRRRVTRREPSLWPLRLGRPLVVTFALVVGASVFAVHPGGVQAAAANSVVNSTGDASDLVAGDGFCDTGATNADGDPECTLRAAIEEANAAGTDSSITFAIPSTDPGYSAAPVGYVLTPASPYPIVTATVAIDATTQSEYGAAGRPVVELDGTAAIGSTAGLVLHSSDSRISGFAVHSFTDEGLEIAGVDGFGDRNVLSANWVGLDLSGTVLGNTENGILVTSGSDDNVIGGTGPGEGNVVAGNNGIGILVRISSFGNALLGNAVYGNTGLGIDLDEDGVTANDAGDGDAGSNDLLNFPVVTSADEVGGTVTLDFDLDVPAGDYRIEIFANPSGADPTGYGEGAAFVTAHSVAGHPGGSGSYSTTFAGSIGDVLTATATVDLPVGYGPTSELSAAYTVTPPNTPPLAVDDGAVTSEDVPVVVAVLGNDSDADGDPLVVDSFGQGGNGGVVDNGDGTLSYTPDSDWNGIDSFTYRAGDGADPSNVATVTVTVSAGGDPPVLDPIGDQAGDELTAIGFTAAATDPDSGDTLTYSLAGEPAGATIDPVTGVFAWTPSEAQGPGAYTFDVVVVDDATPALSDAETITVTVAETNTAPVITSPGDQVNAEGDSVVVDVAAADPDLPADSLTWSAGGLPGGLTIDPATGQITGTVDYSAAASSPYTVTLTVTDDGSPSLQHQAIITWTITDTNRPPVVVADAATTAEDTPVTVAVLANDSDGDGDPLSVDSFTQGGNGAVVGNGDGTVTYTPDPDWNGTDGFTVTVGDGATFGVAAVTITVTPVNDPPLLDPIGGHTVVEQHLLTFTATAGDVDTGDTVTFRLVGAPAGASIDPVSGVFTWTPSESQGGAVYTFDVRVDDDGTPSLSATETIAVTVTKENTRPAITPVPDATVDEQTSLSFTVTASDSDLPVEPLSFSLAGAPNGASIDPVTGAFTWTPTELQGPGVYAFDVVVADPAGSSAAAAVTVTVIEVNRDPVVTDQAARQNDVGDGVTFTVTAVDHDRPQNTLTWTATGLPAGLSIDAASGEIGGVVAVGAEGVHTATVTVTDGAGGSDSTTFTWTVLDGDANTAPDAGADDYSMHWGETLTVGAPGLLGNDDDAEGHAMTAQLGSGPAEGHLTLAADGSFVYVADGAHVAQVQFTYRAVDERGAATTAIVTIELVNRLPVAADDALWALEDTVASLSPLDNDVDPDDDALTIIELVPSVGTAIESGGGLVEYRPPTDFSGEVTIAYTVADPTGATSAATIQVTVLAVNDPPVAAPDHLDARSHREHTIDVIANDSDVDGDALRLVAIGEPARGGAEIAGPTTVVYDPADDLVGGDSLSYTITDGNGGYAVGRLTISVGPEVVVIAVERADAIGVGAVPFDPNPTPADGESGASLTIHGVSLVTQAFFQTIVALELPLFLLLVMIGALYLFARVTHTPLFGAPRRRTWAAVLLGREDHLDVRPEPLAHAPVVYRDLPAVRGIECTGRTRHSDGLDWRQIETPAGRGWVPGVYLLEEHDLESFMADRRPGDVLEAFAEAVERRGRLDDVLSRRGLVVSLGSGVIHYTFEEASRLAAADEPDGHALFESEVRAPFLSAYRATARITPKTAHSATALLPIECRNFLYLTLRLDAAGRPWLVFFEYVNGRPYVVGLGVDR